MSKATIRQLIEKTVNGFSSEDAQMLTGNRMKAALTDTLVLVGCLNACSEESFDVKFTIPDFTSCIERVVKAPAEKNVFGSVERAGYRATKNLFNAFDGDQKYVMTALLLDEIFTHTDGFMGVCHELASFDNTDFLPN